MTQLEDRPMSLEITTESDLQDYISKVLSKIIEARLPAKGIAIMGPPEPGSYYGPPTIIEDNTSSWLLAIRQQTHLDGDIRLLKDGSIVIWTNGWGSGRKLFSRLDLAGLRIEQRQEIAEFLGLIEFRIARDAR